VTAASRGRRFDVAVIGAGPAGCAAALRLRRRGAGRVLLADAGGSGGFRIGESIPPDTRRLLAGLGLWEAFLSQGHERCLGSCSSWGGDGLGYNDFVTNPYGHGWHLDRARFDALLAERAAAAGARLETGWRLETAARPGARGTASGWELTFRTAGGRLRRIEATIAVDATGQRAGLARLAGARRRVADRLITIAGHFRLAAGAPLGKLTLLEARPYGWWYAARLPGGTSIAALTTDLETCRRLSLRHPTAWLCRLAETRHLGARLDGSAFDPAGLAAWPASSFRLDPAHGADWLAVGDAAAAYDPLCSQGIHKALATGLSAGDAIAARLAGEIPDFSDYGASLLRGWREFLGLRSYLYARETRWPGEPFWRARRARGAPEPAAAAA
jgi:flavin-dependent dehydrogenase